MQSMRVEKGNWRIICDCQLHAKQERALWRRMLRSVGSNAKRSGVAFLIGLPLAFGTIGIPTEAMDVSFPRLDVEVVQQEASTQNPQDSSDAQQDASLPVFTTPAMKEAFMHPDAPPRALTIDIVKQEFFRAHVPYGSIIYREAVRNGLAPELVAAVVEAESDFRPRLISHKNAQGLMQIVPETGRLLGAGDLFNPNDNVAAGTRYLRYLLDRFGDQRLALAAYNAGEGNIEKFGGIPPFPETLDYLRRVHSRASLYRQRVRRNYLASMRMRSSLSH